ncbi:uncharacterized protein L199_001715 [Kwoniella botswanensis]|uniref:uncharacterized protein n=1 Tax=Kwoniella botswanensis TaxID=1268659 RepID=UPI00315D6799
MPNTANLDNPSCTALTRSKLRTQHKDGALRTCGKPIRYLPGDSGNDPICYSCRDNKSAMEEYDSRSGRTETDLLRDWKSYPKEANKPERWKEFSRRRRKERISMKRDCSPMSVQETHKLPIQYPTDFLSPFLQHSEITPSQDNPPQNPSDDRISYYDPEVDQQTDTSTLLSVGGPLTGRDPDMSIQPNADIDINFLLESPSTQLSTSPQTRYEQSFGCEDLSSASHQDIILNVNQMGSSYKSASHRAWSQPENGYSFENPSVQSQWESSSIYFASATEDCPLSNPPLARNSNLPAPMNSTEAIMEGVEEYSNGTQELERMIHEYLEANDTASSHF